MKTVVKVLIACAVFAVVALIAVVAILAPFHKAHHTPHATFRIEGVTPVHQATSVLPRLNFQRTGSLHLDAVRYSAFLPRFAWNEEHLVGLVLARSLDLQNVSLLNMRGAESRGEITLAPDGESFQAAEVLQVTLHAVRDETLKAVVVSRKRANDATLEVRLLGWTDKSHWHVYDRWTLDRHTTFANTNRAAFVQLPYGPVLVLGQPTKLQVYAVHELEAVRHKCTIDITELDRHVISVVGSTNRFLVVLHHPFSHHGLVEYNWNDDVQAFKIGSETPVDEHVSLEDLYMNVDGDLLLAHDAQTASPTKSWSHAESWVRLSDHTWKRHQQLIGHMPAPAAGSYGFAASENGDILVLAWTDRPQAYALRKHPDNHWYFMGGHDPDPLSTTVMEGLTPGLATSFAPHLRAASVWVQTAAHEIQLFRWSF